MIGVVSIALTLYAMVLEGYQCHWHKKLIENLNSFIVIFKNLLIKNLPTKKIAWSWLLHLNSQNSVWNYSL